MLNPHLPEEYKEEVENPMAPLDNGEMKLAKKHAKKSRQPIESIVYRMKIKKNIDAAYRLGVEYDLSLARLGFAVEPILKRGNRAIMADIQVVPLTDEKDQLKRIAKGKEELANLSKDDNGDTGVPAVVGDEGDSNVDARGDKTAV